MIPEIGTLVAPFAGNNTEVVVVVMTVVVVVITVVVVEVAGAVLVVNIWIDHGPVAVTAPLELSSKML